MIILNPATEESIEEVVEDSSQSVQQKFVRLRSAQPLWAREPLGTRIACIQRFLQALDTQKDLLARTLSQEVGKPLQQAYNELSGAAKRIQFFIEQSPKYLGEEWQSREDATKEKITYEPLGVLANISAWNYPYLVGVNVFIPALIGGNAVFYKPSEYATLTGLHIQRLMKEAGVPTDCFAIAIGKGSVGELLLDLPFDGYYFTGSYATGRYIAERVAHKLVPCQLELGGKDPLYVMDDVADIDAVASAALEGVVYNCGQSCCAVERIYVHKKIFEKFVASFVAQAKGLVVGDPMDSTTAVGPLVRKEQQAFLLAQIADAKAKGATVLCGGGIPSRKGFFFEPTVLVDVDQSMQIMNDESFGPVVGIQQVEDDEEALECMLATEFGLTAAIYSASFERAEQVMKQLDTGTVYWNCCDRVSANLPWSGRRNSGMGATLSYQGIRAFVQPKAWHIRP